MLPQQGRLQASFDFSVDEEGLNAVLSDAASALDLESDASRDVHFDGVVALKNGILPPLGDQILLSGCLLYTSPSPRDS